MSPTRAVTLNDGLVEMSSCSMNEPSLEASRHLYPGCRCSAHALHFARLVDDALGPGLLVGRGHVPRILEHRRDEVLDVLLHARELDVALLGNGARARDLDREPRNATDFVLGDDRAAGEAPDAAVDHADAEAAGLTFRVGWNAAATPASATSAPAASATTPASAAAGASSATGTSRAAGRVEVRGTAGDVRVHGEAHVGVARALLLRFAEDDVGQALELGLQHVALRRLREQIQQQIRRGDGDARPADRLDERTA
jgi:hypothetical protein